MIGVAIVDDDPYARSGLATQIGRCPGEFTVVAACPSVEDLVRQPLAGVDVVVLDVVVGPGNTFAGHVDTLDKAGLRILAITCDLTRGEVVPVLRRFPISLLAKDDLTDEVLHRSLRITAEGQVVVSPFILNRLHAAGTRMPDLTPRQKDVLELLANGVPAKVAARKLGIRYDTLHDHVTQIRERFRQAGHPADDWLTMHYKAIELGYIPDPRGRT